MQPGDILNRFILTFETWQESLDNYSLYQLQKRPEEQSWSLGQVYMHLIEQTVYYNIPQIDICISSNDNAEKLKSLEGNEIFRQNSFPAARLKFASENPNQPESIEEIRQGFYQIKNLLTDRTPKIAANKFRGKTKHPGFDFLNANEWLQFIEMHFRHHLHQKKRLDKFLNSV